MTTQWYDHPDLHRIFFPHKAAGDIFRHWSVEIRYGFYESVPSGPSQSQWTFHLPAYDAPLDHRTRPATTVTMWAPNHGMLAPQGGSHVDWIPCPSDDEVFTLWDPATGDYLEIWFSGIVGGRAASGLPACINYTTKTVTADAGLIWDTGNTKTGTGVGDPTTNLSAGVRASNFPWIGGLLRKAEIDVGVIDHALVFGVPAFGVNGNAMCAGGGPPVGRYRSPATGGNGPWPRGPLDLGTRIGIPAGVPEPAGLSPIGVTVFRCLQKYGAFLGDGTGGLYPQFYTNHFDWWTPTDTAHWDSNTIDGTAFDPLCAFWNHGGSADMEKIGPLLRIADYQPYRLMWGISRDPLSYGLTASLTDHQQTILDAETALAGAPRSRIFDVDAKPFSWGDPILPNGAYDSWCPSFMAWKVPYTPTEADARALARRTTLIVDQSRIPARLAAIYDENPACQVINYIWPTFGLGQQQRAAPWVSGQAYTAGAVVAYQVSGVFRYYQCKAAVSSATPPSSDAAHWFELSTVYDVNWFLHKTNTAPSNGDSNHTGSTRIYRLDGGVPNPFPMMDLENAGWTARCLSDGVGFLGQGYKGIFLDVMGGVPFSGLTVSVNTTSNVCTLNAHGWVDGQTIIFTAVANLTNVSPYVTYYLRDVTANTFKLEANPGSGAIDIGGTGSLTLPSLTDVDGVAALPVHKTAKTTAGDADRTWTVGSFWTQAQWMAACADWATAYNTQIEATAGRPALIVPNGIKDGTTYLLPSTPPGAISSAPLAAAADKTAMCENFIRTSAAALTSFRAEAVWKKDPDMLVAATAAGHAILCITKLWTDDPGQDAAAPALYAYALATFLLGAGPGHKFAFTDVQSWPGLTATRGFDPLDLGAPLGPYALVDSAGNVITSGNGLYRREFERGTVIVNAQTATRSMPLRTSMTALDPTTGATTGTATSSASLAANTAAFYVTSPTAEATSGTNYQSSYVPWTATDPSHGGRAAWINLSTARAGAGIARWADIAAGAEDAYLDILASRLIGFGNAPYWQSFYFCLHPRPELVASSGPGGAYGTAADYLAAWAHIRAKFDARGVDHAIYACTFDATSWALPTSDYRHPSRYVPSSDIVHVVGASAYNFAWSGGSPDYGNWRTIEQLIDSGPDGFYQWVGTNRPRAHQWVTIGCVENPGDANARATWFVGAALQLVANYQRIRGVIYDDSCLIPGSPSTASDWRLTGPASQASARTAYVNWGSVG